MTIHLDRRFSDPSAVATPWDETERVLRAAQLYWLTTVRADGRPHVTPLIGVFVDDAVHFCTGLDEQKTRNLAHAAQVAITTGGNSWAAGLDVVVEGTARRIEDRPTLHKVAGAYLDKYGEPWNFTAGDGVLTHPDDENVAALFRVEPDKVLAFAKQPHGQTSYRIRNARR
ncbi:pyridoxamine 5'-phosphate oxidase family protein [Pseudonocardiaceae bacterium YIM PH 21723]|nr:pyridoxamine 5'-phosphate oxidase family protein [Pseudonocardiaceae bacterium YIM PH 21723]